MGDVVSVILDLFERHGDSAYLGEPVSQREHALQSAYLAEQSGASPALIAAALLHDIGHLLDSEAADPTTIDHDQSHEQHAAKWLRNYFGESVVRPVELHVSAKRYLCAVEPSYFAGLSPASVASLRLQGGPMSAIEVDAFRGDPFAEDAVRLRRWDDGAKVAGWITPPVTHFRRYLEDVRRR